MFAILRKVRHIYLYVTIYKGRVAYIQQDFRAGE